MTYNASITNIQRFLWLLRLASWLCGGTLRVWRARGRKKIE